LNKILPQVEFAIPRPSFDSLSHNKLVKKILSVFNLKQRFPQKNFGCPVNINKIRDSVIDKIKDSNSGNQLFCWMSQERTSYVSSMINRSIDEMAIHNGVVLTSDNKKNIFAAIEKKFPDIKLDEKSAQTSISHTALNEIASSGLRAKILKRYSSDMDLFNTQMKDLTNLVSSSVYDKIFNESTKVLQIEISAEVLKAVYRQSNTN
ncbi:type III secretion effector IpgB1, partial [Shigella flexneri]|nr:type III secretion effector IpgB1 [Shigella flexneri]